MTPHDKFQATRTELADALIEREQEIDLVLTAIVSQEHVLFVGPPGTGKSMLADGVVSWMNGTKFQLLMTKYTTPEEVFGPISLTSMKADRYKRIIDGKLPDAKVAFVDEVFKGSSAILNTMLQVLNERTFRNDDVLVACPLALCIGASNEWPGDQEGGKELGALFDRFLFRKLVKPIATEKSLHRLLWDKGLAVTLSTRLDEAELQQVTREASALPWSDPAKEAFHDIHREARKEGISPGDRRLRKAVKAAQSFAWLAGAVEVEPDHLEILGHVLWDDPAEQPRKLAEIVGRIANPSGMKVNSLLMEAEQIIGECDCKDLSKTAVSMKKLGEIKKQLAGLDGARAAQAKDYIEQESRRIKKASVDSF